MKRIIYLLVLLALSSISLFADNNELNFKEGDIIFQISKSQQSSMIQYATKSPYSHCGIIIIKNNKFYVLEASNIVKLTPINDFIAKGKNSNFKVKRYNGKIQKIKYKKYLGLKYDLAFKLNNGKFYCSELVYHIYKTQFGIELCKPKQIKDYCIQGLNKVMKKRGIKEDQYVIAPSDILNSELLEDTDLQFNN